MSTALVTGGNRGIGLAIALAFAGEGAHVAICGRDEAALERARAAIAERGVRTVAIVADLFTAEGCARAVSDTAEAFGRLDVLVNNAGILHFAPLLETALEDYMRVIETNQVSCFLGMKAAGAAMKAAGGGSIINISSTASIRPSPQTAPYAAAKAGLNAITVAYAHEYGPKVRVNCIMAGPFHTDVSKAWSRSEGFTEYAREAFALGRVGDPDEIVGAALYFASDASSFTSGAVLRVDGGTP